MTSHVEHPQLCLRHQPHPCKILFDVDRRAQLSRFGAIHPEQIKANVNQINVARAPATSPHF